MSKDPHKLNRRQFLKLVGMGSASAVAMAVLKPFDALANPKSIRYATQSGQQPLTNAMTYRVNPNTGDKVSLIGYGMMRLPQKDGQIDQELVNQEVDYAIAHGINYFDTAPRYCGGRSETATGIALSRHPRDKYYIATKMSNQSRNMWPIEESKKMYYQSFKSLQVDYINYYLMHSVGGSGMKDFRPRFLDNGLLDFLLEERKAGRIRNLGFSYHGNVEVFDWLLDHQEQYHWDFCQIELNYVDWRHASTGRKKDADAEYLYNKCEKAGVQCVIMEPLLGGRLTRLPEEFASQLKARRPNDSQAAWSFRWIGTLPNVLTALSGMTLMEHLVDNVKTFSPLDPCTEQEKALLARIADDMQGYPTIPCTACEYCMPCPYGVNIPANFAYYNEAVNKKLLPLPDKTASDYRSRHNEYVKGYKKALGELQRADKCMDCEECLAKCPQQIRIPNQMARLVELL